MVLDSLSRELGLKFKTPLFSSYAVAAGGNGNVFFYLVKPLTYMNKSGKVLKKLLKKTGLTPDNLIVICDNMDLKPGVCRFKLKGSSVSQHNGLASIIEAAGTSLFKRIYIGIGRTGRREDVITHVLGNPSNDENVLIKRSINRTARCLSRVTEGRIDQVAGMINGKTDKDCNEI